ncbi:MAG: DUF2312 domain-containing protein [Thalassobaculum sp.]|jgi:uncharacterized protein (UPF0335 family)
MSDDYDTENATPAGSHPPATNSALNNPGASTSAPAADADSPYIGGINAGQLESFIQRIENLEEEKANLMADIREIFAEAKANGYDVKIMRQILKLRKMEEDDRDEQETLLEVYKRALGMG